MREIDWEAICEEYVEGTASFRELARKHGVSVRALSERGRAGEWPARRRLGGSRERTADGGDRMPEAGGGRGPDRGPGDDAGENRAGGEAARAARRLRRMAKNLDEEAVAAGMRRKALLILDRLFDDCTEMVATEQRFVEDGVTNVRKLRDMTAILRELTGGATRGAGGDVEDLAPLAVLLEQEDD